MKQSAKLLIISKFLGFLLLVILGGCYDDESHLPPEDGFYVALKIINDLDYDIYVKTNFYDSFSPGTTARYSAGIIHTDEKYDNFLFFDKYSDDEAIPSFDEFAIKLGASFQDLCLTVYGYNSDKAMWTDELSTVRINSLPQSVIETEVRTRKNPKGRIQRYITVFSIPASSLNAST